MEWISVKDRLPNPEKGYADQVIVSNYIINGTPERVVICAVYHGNEFYMIETWSEEGTEGEIIKGVTHWMPLPKPPKF